MSSLDGSTVYVRNRAGVDIEITAAIDIDKIGGSRTKRDRTLLKDHDKHYRFGKRDNGTIAIKCFADESDAGQIELDVAYAEDTEADKSERMITVVKPDAKALQFDGGLESFPEADSGEQDGETTRTASFQVNGKIRKLASFTPAT